MTNLLLRMPDHSACTVAAPCLVEQEVASVLAALDALAEGQNAEIRFHWASTSDVWKSGRLFYVCQGIDGSVMAFTRKAIEEVVCGTRSHWDGNWSGVRGAPVDGSGHVRPQSPELLEASTV